MWTGGLPHLPGVPYLHVNRPLVWTATTKGNLSYTLNFKPAQLAERVWCTKVLSSLLNIYFHLFSSQARSFYLLPLRVEQVFILHQKYGSNPIRYVTPHFRDWRSAASLLRHRNRAATIVFVCGQKPYPVWFPWRGKSYLVLLNYLRSTKRKPSTWQMDEGQRTVLWAAKPYAIKKQTEHWRPADRLQRR